MIKVRADNATICLFVKRDRLLGAPELKSIQWCVCTVQVRYLLNIDHTADIAFMVPKITLILQSLVGVSTDVQ